MHRTILADSAHRVSGRCLVTRGVKRIKDRDPSSGRRVHLVASS